MLRMSAARVAATATRPAGAAGLLRPLSSLAVGHTERQSHRDVLVGRIARKLASAHAPPSSIEALDDKVEFLRRLGLSKDRALAAISLHPTVGTFVDACVWTNRVLTECCWRADAELLGANDGEQGGLSF